MTLLIALLLEWKFGLLDFSDGLIRPSLILTGTLLIWFIHLWAYHRLANGI